MIKNTEKRAIGSRLQLLRAKVRHLGTEENLEILKRIYEYIESNDYLIRDWKRYNETHMSSSNNI